MIIFKTRRSPTTQHSVKFEDSAKLLLSCVMVDSEYIEKEINLILAVAAHA